MAATIPRYQTGPYGPYGTAPQPVVAPTNLRTTATTSSTISLAWDAPAGSYTLQRAPVTNGTPGTFVTVYTGTTKAYQNSALTFNTTYAYQVKVAVNGVDSAYSLVEQFTTATQGTPGTTTFSRQQIIDGLLYKCFIGGVENAYTVFPVTNNGHTNFSIDIETWNTSSYEPYVHINADGNWVAIAQTPAGTGPPDPNATDVYKSRIITVTGTIPAGATQLRFRTGPAIFHDSDFVYRAFSIMGLRLSGGAGATVTSVPRKQEVFFVGTDSIPSVVVPNNSAGAIMQLVRDALPNVEVICVAASGAWINKRFPTKTARQNVYTQALVDALPSTFTKAVYWDGDGRNAFGKGEGVPSFELGSAEVADGLRIRKPALRTLSQRNLYATNIENINTAGYVAQDYGDAKHRVALNRPDYMRETADSHDVFVNKKTDGTHPDPPDGTQAVATFMVNEYNQTTPSIGTAVFQEPPVADEVILDMPFSVDLLNHSAKNIVFTQAGAQQVTIDSAKQAASFTGNSYLQASAGTFFAHPRGYGLELDLQANGAQNDGYYELYDLTSQCTLTQHVSNGSTTIVLNARRGINDYVTLESLPLNIAANFVHIGVAWNRSIGKIYFGVAGQPVQSADFAQAYVPTGTGQSVTVGKAFTGWIKNLKDTATGSAPTPPAQVPTITSGNANGAPSSQQTLTGTNFGTSGAVVNFGSGTAAVVSQTDTDLVYMVPANATGTSNVSVTTNAGTSNVVTFAAVVPPGLARSYDFTQGFNDLSGNGLDLTPTGTGNAPAITANGAQFNGQYLDGPKNFRDTYDAGYDFDLELSPVYITNAYYSFMGYGAHVDVSGQLVNNNTQIIYKLYHETGVGVGYALAVSDPYPITQAVRLRGNYNGSTISLQVNNDAPKTDTATALTASPAGQQSIQIGKSRFGDGQGAVIKTAKLSY